MLTESLQRGEPSYGRVRSFIDINPVDKQLPSQDGELCPSVSHGPSFSFGVLGRTQTIRQSLYLSTTSMGITSSGRGYLFIASKARIGVRGAKTSIEL